MTTTSIARRALDIIGAVRQYRQQPGAQSYQDCTSMKCIRPILFVAVLLACLPVQPARAALVRFDFTGTLNNPILGESCNEFECSNETFLPVGTPFSGSWTVELDQVGAPYPYSFGGATQGKLYHYETLTLRLGGITLSGGPFPQIFVTTQAVPDSLLDFWPSGFSSDFVVSSGAFPGDAEPVLGTTSVWRIDLSFSRDGNDVWSDFMLPTDARFFPAMNVASWLVLHGSRSTFIIGNIDTLVATPVPLPSVLPVWVVVLGLILRKVRNGNQTA